MAGQEHDGAKDQQPDRIARRAALMGISRDKLLAMLADPATDWDAFDREQAKRPQRQRGR